MDFVSDSLYDGRRFRALTVVDTMSRESSAIEVDTSLRAKRVVAVLERLALIHGLPPPSPARRQRPRVYLEGARRVGASPRRQAVIQSAWDADR